MCIGTNQRGTEDKEKEKKTFCLLIRFIHSHSHSIKINIPQSQINFTSLDQKTNPSPLQKRHYSISDSMKNFLINSRYFIIENYSGP